MARPKNPELTDRELAVMQVFWKTEEATAEQARQALLKAGEEVAYVTIANVVRGLLEKGFLKQTHSNRPFRYTAIRSFDDISTKLLGDFMGRLFQGSRQAMLVQLLKHRRLSKSEREVLEKILDGSEDR